MKKFITPAYEFFPGSGGGSYVKFLGVPNFSIKKLVAIINTNQSRVIYATGVAGLGYASLDGTIVYLNFDTSGHSNTDNLQIIYEDEFTSQLTSDEVNEAEGEDVPEKVALIGGQDQFGRVKGLRTDASGNLKVAGSLSGAAALNQEETQLLVKDRVDALASQLAQIIAQLPASLGAKTIANSLSVTFASDASSFNAIPVFIQSSNPVLNVAQYSQQFTDKSSGAVTTTTTTSLSGGVIQAIAGIINVTAVSGTNPTLDIAIWESRDSGTNYEKIYDMPRITATGQYYFPIMMVRGNRYRFVQTVGGSTPSFTYSINTMRSNQTVPTVRAHIDRAIDPNTINSVSAGIRVCNCRKIMIALEMSAMTGAPIVTLQGSFDGVTWYDTSKTITGAVGMIVGELDTIPNYVRGKITTAGSGCTLTQLVLKGMS